MKNYDYIVLIKSINAIREALNDLTEELNFVQKKVTELYEKEFENEV